MAHIVVLGLVLTLVAGVCSFAVLLRKIHARPSRLPQSIPTPLLLYNLWIATWLVSQYLGFYLFPSVSRPTAQRIGLALMCVQVFLSLAWLRGHLVLIDEFLGSDLSRVARRTVTWYVYGAMVLFVSGLAVRMANVGSPLVGAIVSRVTNDPIFPLALAGSIVLAVGARRQHDEPVRRALSVLAHSYATLFTLLTILALVIWRLRLLPAPVALSMDLVLEFAYNVLTVVWVVRYADAFAAPAPEEADGGRGFDQLCEAFGISKREAEIVELVCQGLTNREIANRLFISVGTVKDHNYTIFQKAGVRNRTQLAQLFTQLTGARDRARDRRARLQAFAASSDQGDTRFCGAESFLISYAEQPGTALLRLVSLDGRILTTHPEDTMLKKAGSILLLLSLGAVLSADRAAGQTPTASKAEAILDAYVEKCGGRAAFEKIVTSRTTSTASMPMLPAPMDVTAVTARDGRFHRVIKSASIGTIEYGSDGRIVWEINPLTGPQVMKGADEHRFRLLYDLNTLARWRETFKKVEYLGEATLDGKPAFKVAAALHDDYVVTFSFDQASALLLMMECPVQTATGRSVEESRYGDYRPVDGMLFPFRQVRKGMGPEMTITFKTVEYNVDVPDGEFRVPDVIARIAGGGK